MKEIVLLGGSNSLKKGGLKDGLKKNAILNNLSLGASSSLQNLYELVRNRDLIKNADLIITESNVNDFHNANQLGDNLCVIKRNINLYYEELATFSSPVIVIILPLQTEGYNFIDDICLEHVRCAEHYGFNIIDMHKYFKDNELCEYYYFDNLDHPLLTMMSYLGQKITENTSRFHNHEQEVNNKSYVVFTDFGSNVIKKFKKNSLFDENVVKVEAPFYINSSLDEYTLLGFHCWSDKHSSLIVRDTKNIISKAVNTECQFHDIYRHYRVNRETVLEAEVYKPTEKSIRVDEKQKLNKELDLIGLLLSSSVDIKDKTEYKANDFSEILSFIKFFKQHTDEYITIKGRYNRKKSIVKKVYWAISSKKIIYITKNIFTRSISKFNAMK